MSTTALAPRDLAPSCSAFSADSATQRQACSSDLLAALVFLLVTSSPIRDDTLGVFCPARKKRTLPSMPAALASGEATSSCSGNSTRVSRAWATGAASRAARAMIRGLFMTVPCCLGGVLVPRRLAAARGSLGGAGACACRFFAVGDGFACVRVDARILQPAHHIIGQRVGHERQRAARLERERTHGDALHIEVADQLAVLLELAADASPLGPGNRPAAGRVDIGDDDVQGLACQRRQLLVGGHHLALRS